MRKLPVFASLLLALAGLLAGAAASDAAVGVTVSPSRIRLVKPAGESAPGKLYIQNNGSYAVRVSTEVTDIKLGKNEEGLSIRDEAPPGTTTHSCAAWIQIVNVEDLVILPGKQGVLEFVVSPPPNVTAGGYGAYLFVLCKPAEAPERKKTNVPEVQLVTVPRLGVSVVYEVQGTVERKGELTTLEISPPTKTKPLSIRHEFLNTGNAEVILSGTFHIMDAQNMLAGKGPLRLLKTFPQERAVMETTWSQSLPPGQYTALITFELGPDGREAIVRELKFEVPNPQ